MYSMYAYLNSAWFVKSYVLSYVLRFYFQVSCRAYTICAHRRVGLPVLFRLGRGLRKDRQIKPLS